MDNPDCNRTIVVTAEPPGCCERMALYLSAVSLSQAFAGAGGGSLTQNRTVSMQKIMIAKIDNAATTLLSIPLKRPVEGHPYLGRRATSNFVILQLKTEDGLSGFGLSHTSTVGKARALQVMVQELFPLLLGQSALDHEGVYQRAHTFFTDLGHSGAALQALAAIDIALWDLKGKALGQPLYRLLGAQRERVECYYSGGLRRQQTIDQLVADAADIVARGFGGMKLRLGARPFAEDVERV